MQIATADGEAPLPNGVGAGKEERKLKRSNSFARALGPTMVCVYALLVLKTAQQGFVDSLPLITVRRRQTASFAVFRVNPCSQPSVMTHCRSSRVRARG